MRRPSVQPGQLLVISNRLPFQAIRRKRRTEFVPSAGGLVTALEPALRENGGVWVGWPGAVRGFSADRAALPADRRILYRPVPLSNREVKLYYGEFANRTIWPLFHYFVGRTRIDGRTWPVYEHVNQRFAETAAEGPEPGLVWVHDYHLLRVAHHLRRIRPTWPLAFFLHIPFPHADVLRVLPWARELLRGLLASDLVAFQVPTY
ncbi:MAG TPA: trehalose-6-phosphate synthase, partial [Gemmatimonadales bacterium]|nr:trehalose-6-phosphate synthase [Gemmatimonadales bacterium]